jgi:hypothetical protein
VDAHVASFRYRPADRQHLVSAGARPAQAYDGGGYAYQPTLTVHDPAPRRRPRGGPAASGNVDFDAHK